MRLTRKEMREVKKLLRQRKQNVNWTRSKKFVNHHIKNRINGGTKTKSNLIRLEENREKAWHFLFHNLSFEEVVELLLRVIRLKRHLN